MDETTPLRWDTKKDWVKEIDYIFNEEIDNVDLDDIKGFINEIVELKIELGYNNIKINIEDVYKLWKGYSSLYCAGFLVIGETNDDFINMVKEYLKYNKKKEVK